MTTPILRSACSSGHLALAGLCCLALSSRGQFQRSGQGGGLSGLRPLIIQLDNARGSLAATHSSPFGYFEVIDERADTAIIGVQGNLPMRSHAFDRQLVFRDPATREIGTYLNRFFIHAGGPDTAVVILRCLWLSDTDPLTDDHGTVNINENAPRRTHIRLRAEIYARHNGRYLPLIRVDTLDPTRLVSYSILRSTYLGWEKELASLFTQVTEKAILAYGRKAASGRRISWEDIRRFNAARFDIPIFDTARLKRGVYTAFEEFRNNDPSIHDFEVLPQNGDLALYLKNGDGTSYYTHNAWGFCNGKQVFLMRDGLLHLLHQDGNLFYFYGIDIPSADLLALPLSVFNGSQEQHCIYVVDMDTGQFY
ncbi:MAG TPA: hypothetical protein VGR89_03925 [Puia sp.]|nr:hypothetical protein [Puia sp.]